MPELTIQFRDGAVHLPELGLWLDPRAKRTGPERVFVSHAHSDHIGAHRAVILTAPTARLMRARLGGKRIEHVLPFGEATPFQNGPMPFALTLLPAGHILGSAMAFVEVPGRSLLYTGDFKLRRGLSAEPCQSRPADILIMETTFGRSQYRFPPADAVFRGIIEFCRETLANEATPVLLAYSLGKSQELLCGLVNAGLPLMLHDSVYKLTRIYEEFGQLFPTYQRWDPAQARGCVLLGPPGFAGSTAVRELGPVRSAIVTGWALDSSCRYRSRTDAAFPLSDHADFQELIEMVRQVAPRKVYTLHGFAAEFAAELRQLGIDAQALGQEEQLTLPLFHQPLLASSGTPV